MAGPLSRAGRPCIITYVFSVATALTKSKKSSNQDFKADSGIKINGKTLARQIDHYYPSIMSGLKILILAWLRSMFIND